MQNDRASPRPSSAVLNHLNQGLLTSYEPHNPVKSQRLTRFSIICGMIAAIAPLQFGYKLSELNIIKDAIINCDNPLTSSGFNWSLPKCLPMDENYFALATSIFALGGLVGSLFAGYLSDRFGRKRVLLYNSIIFLIGATIQAFSLNAASLIFGRFVSGISSGTAIVITPIYLTEIAPIHARGTLNLFNQMSIVIGLLLAQIIGYFFETGNRWRMVFIISMLLSLVNFGTMFLIVESPKYLYYQSNIAQAEVVLQKLRNNNDVREEIESWENPSQNNASTSSNENMYETRISESELPSSNILLPERNINLINIFGIRKYRQPIFLVVCLQLGQQATGISAVVFYSTSIFKEIYSSKTSAILTLVFGIVNLVMTIFAINIIEQIPRKKLLLSSIIAMFISMLIFVISSFQQLKIMVVISLFMVIASFAPGFGPLPFLLSTELFDTKALGAGNSISISTNWIGTFISGVTFFGLQNAIGNYVFVIYMGLMVIFAIIYIFYLPETKNKTFEKVSEDFVF
ncbi:hypothetical protein BB561_005427 [Smittium simulii]|uniref:Major facilitator superfamily (MFS) profile domain-containing protein n=1 Tax=Smittium simulii TaxID=133385 RepID=A0A2T9YAF8_9FUNG|nr:hypothetical protein BB561_005427 [Smittium simulii]